MCNFHTVVLLYISERDEKFRIKHLSVNGFAYYLIEFYPSYLFVNRAAPLQSISIYYATLRMFLNLHRKSSTAFNLGLLKIQMCITCEINTKFSSAFDTCWWTYLFKKLLFSILKLRFSIKKKQILQSKSLQLFRR